MDNSTALSSTKGTADPRIARIEILLGQGDHKAAVNLIDKILAKSILVPRLFPHIHAICRRHGQEEALTDMVLRSISTVPHRIDAGFVFSDFARDTGFLPKFMDIIAGKKGPPIRLSIAPPMRPLRFYASDRDDPRLSDLIRIKYNQIRFPQCISNIQEAAQKLSGQIDIPEDCVDFLYPHTRMVGLSKGAWISACQFATALDEIMVDFDLMPVDVKPLFHPDTSAIIKSARGGRTGTIFLTGHLGFVGARFGLIREFLPDVLLVLREGLKAPYLWQADDSRAALFCSLKAVLAGTSIFIAPDGPMGDTEETLDILGKPLPIGKGASFVAYDTGATTAWIDFDFANGQFKPRITFGPKRRQGERLVEFASRFREFYRDRVVTHFTGDPSHIVAFSIFRLMTIQRRKRNSPGDE